MGRRDVGARPHGRRAASVVAIIVMTAAFAGFARTAAYADGGGSCSQWNVAGTWTVSQSNVGGTFQMMLTQTGDVIGGTAGDSSLTVVSGHVDGNTFDVVIDWQGAPGSAGSAGHYTATVSPSALVNGFGFDVNNPASTATWSASGTATLSGGGKDLTVPAGATCYLVAGTTISHDLKVARGGTLIMLGGIVGHDLNVEGMLNMSGGTVGHDLNARNAQSVDVTAGNVGHDVNANANANIQSPPLVVWHKINM